MQSEFAVHRSPSRRKTDRMAIYPKLYFCEETAAGKVREMGANENRREGEARGG